MNSVLIYIDNIIYYIDYRQSTMTGSQIKFKNNAGFVSKLFFGKVIEYIHTYLMLEY